MFAGSEDLEGEEIVSLNGIPTRESVGSLFIIKPQESSRFRHSRFSGITSYLCRSPKTRHMPISRFPRMISTIIGVAARAYGIDGLCALLFALRFFFFRISLPTNGAAVDACFDASLRQWFGKRWVLSAVTSARFSWENARVRKNRGLAPSG